MSFLENISNFFNKKKKSEAIQLTEVKPIQIKPVENKEPITLQSGTKAFLEGGANALPFAEQIKTGVKNYFDKNVPQAREFGQKLIDKYGFKPYEEYQPKTTPEKALYTSGAVTSNVAQFVATGKAVDAVMSPIIKNLTVIGNASKYGYSAKEALGLIKAAEKATGVSVKATNAIINNAITWGLYQAPRLTGTTTEEKTRQLATSMITGGVFGKLQMMPGMTPLIKYLANALSPFIIKSTIGGDTEGAKDELPAYALMAMVPFLGSVKFKPGSNPKLPAVPGAEFSGGVPPAGVVNPPATIKTPEVPIKSPVVPIQVPSTSEIVRPSPSSDVVVPETTPKIIEKKEIGNNVALPLKITNSAGNEIPLTIYKNITPEQAIKIKSTYEQGYLKENENPLRAVVDKNGNAYTWKASEATHDEIIKNLRDSGIEAEVNTNPNKDFQNKIFGIKTTSDIKEPKTTITKLEKQITGEKFQNYLYEAKDQSDYIKRVTVLKEQLNKPDIQTDVKKLKQVKTLINQELQNLTGNISTGNWKSEVRQKSQIAITTAQPIQSGVRLTAPSDGSCFLFSSGITLALAKWGRTLLASSELS